MRVTYPQSGQAAHMGRTVYWMNVSLDLRIERADGEDGGGGWMRIGEPLHAEFNRRASQLALMIEGRRIHEIMEPFWPTAADDPEQPEVMREYGRIWTRTPKVMVSNTRTESEHARIIGGEDVFEQIATLRAETDGFVGVGGANLATQLLERGLLDELLLFTHPVVLGEGRPLFDRLQTPLELDLLEQAQFDDGVTMHRYSIRGASAT
ncbi:MAG: bifunctional deaminase-reductase protein [Thermoleophilia bacterium]|nr:bifunctional deaminase-reductase protein [Thermoleophilia bacterium]